MTAEEAKITVDRMKEFHNSGETLPYAFRIEQLKKLKEAIKLNEQAIFAALAKDLGKSGFETYATEIGFLYEEISHTLRHLKKWMKPEKVKTPIFLFPSRSKIYSVPLGVVFVIGPWNYPFQLLIAPLIGAIAAGNCAVVKPSELTPAVAEVVKNLLENTFSQEYITTVLGEGGRVVPVLIENSRFDHIFFTGSVPVGKKIAELAAKQLIPTTLELGGKSPCIVDESADLDISARRIAWGKFVNAGQTCVSPDYLLLSRKIKEKFLERLKFYIEEFYGKRPEESPDFGKIVNDNHFERLKSYLDQGKVVYGGVTDKGKRFISPTLIESPRENSNLMNDEIFGPLLPVIEYNEFDEAIKFIKGKPWPLSLYLFSNLPRHQERVINEIPFGGGCINNAVVHLGNPYLPFGGIGTSGTGAYHGKFSFDTFSHKKGVLKTSFRLDPKFRYPPYNNKLKLLKKIVKP